MVRVLPPWFENIGKRQVKAPRVFLRDSGVLHALLGLSDLGQVRGHPKLGASWAGFVMEQVIALLSGRAAAAGCASARHRRLRARLLLGENVATVPSNRGLFLDRTWRLHPDICAFTSELFYESRLHAREKLERPVVRGPGPLTGSGLRYVAVEHTGNTSESPEEVGVVTSLVANVTDGEHTWIDADEKPHVITLRDVLVVAPYNAQVAALAQRLPPGARVGTVDKFQGQEAPIVIYSVATSCADDAPRAMAFLYSPNRLNVATSRARCLAVVVASPLGFVPECRSPEQMRLANAFCRFAELRSSPSRSSPGETMLPAYRQWQLRRCGCAAREM